MMGIGVAAVCWCLWGGGELTEQEKQAVSKAYAACVLKVDEAANELEKWYMRYSDDPTEEAAEELIGEEAKWAMNASEEKCEAFTRKVVLKHLFTEKDEVAATSWRKQLLRQAWGKEEKKLAQETNCPDLCEKVKIRDVKGGELTKAFDDKPFYKNLRHEMFNAVQLLKDIEPYKANATTVGGAIGTAVGSPGGPLAPVVGAVVGSAAGWVVRKGVDWVANPAGGIQKVLDDRVRKTAQERKKRFRDMMMKELVARRKDWERQLR